MRDDLRWLGLAWTEPMFTQSERLSLYRAALAQLHAAGHIFPCNKSRRDVLSAASAPHESSDDEPVYPREFRPPADAPLPPLPPLDQPITTNWRFRVSDDKLLSFPDLTCGPQHAIAGRDFGDFLVWRKDNLPSYQLACAVDDALLGITEVVRGADLIRSTFRQLLLFRAFGKTPPAYYHCPLVLDADGQRLAKRHDALALRTLREQGVSPTELLVSFRENFPTSPSSP